MKIKNIKTNEILTFSDDWKVVEEKKKAKIKGQKFIDLFKHWANVNEDACNEYEKLKKQFVYCKDKDMLFYDGASIYSSYGIGFCDFLALQDLKDGEHYSYYDLVGEE